jgi:flagellar basal-body rod protein FlgB
LFVAEPTRRNGRCRRAEVAYAVKGGGRTSCRSRRRRNSAGSAHRRTSQSVAHRASSGGLLLAASSGTARAFHHSHNEEFVIVMNEMFASSSIPVVEQWLNFAQSRHEVLASNVANIDVPGYRTRDLSVDQFQAKLKEAVAVRDSQPSGPTSLGRVEVNPFAEVRDDLQNILYHDDSNVGLEQQVAEITKNHMQHNLALTILNGQFRMLQAAVTERA